jgi:hypothetical protein
LLELRSLRPARATSQDAIFKNKSSEKIRNLCRLLRGGILRTLEALEVKGNFYFKTSLIEMLN